MATMLDTRRTRWSDASGRLHEQFKMAWDGQFIAAAHKAGVPEHWLLPNGAELPVGTARWELAGSMDGSWSDLVYQLDTCLRGTDWADTRSLALRMNLDHVVHCLDWMKKLLEYLKIPLDTPGLIPFEVYEWRVRCYQVNGWELPDYVELEEAPEPAALSW